jgi:hypothetical protein
VAWSQRGGHRPSRGGSAAAHRQSKKTFVKTDERVNNPSCDPSPMTVGKQ